MYLFASRRSFSRSWGRESRNPHLFLSNFSLFCFIIFIFVHLSGIKSTHFATCVDDKARSGRFVLIFKVET